MKRSSALLCLSLSLILVHCGDDGTGADCHEGFCGVDQASISVTPDFLTFASSAIGEASPQFITITSVGEATLIVSDVRLESGGDEFKIEGIDLPLRLAPGEEWVIKVEYIPADCRIDRGNVVITSNDPEARQVELPLQPQAMTGQVRVHPNPIDFGRVGRGECADVTLQVANAGNCALEVNDLFASGSSDVGLPEDLTLPIHLEPSETTEIPVSYCASGDGYDEGALILRSDDANNRSTEVPVFANSGAPCITVTGEDGIDFGEAFFGETHPRTITVTNCNNRELLVVDSIELAAHGERLGLDRFALTDVPELGDSAAIDPGDSRAFVLSYSPILYTPETHPGCSDEEGCAISDGALLVLESNDEYKSPLEIDVAGLGSDNHCPVAVARARVQGGSVWDVMVDGATLDTLELDASLSTDADGSISIYQWTVLDHPGTSTTLSPGPGVADPTFFMDLAGQYRFRLDVFDDEGAMSCEPAEVLALATAGGAIHVQMVWSTPGDPNPNDSGAGTGSDVDLHFVHPNGCWNDPEYDAHFLSPEPNWGDRGTTDDDPRLNLDDTDGWGPEDINLDEAEGTSAVPFVYTVGAYYFADHAYGPSDVTVRVFLGGIMMFEDTMRGLEHHQFWEVATIEWPSREITRVGTVVDGLPDCR